MKAREQEQPTTTDSGVGEGAHNGDGDDDPERSSRVGSATLDDIVPRLWGDVEGYGVTDAGRGGEGLVDSLVQSPIAGVAMGDSSRSTMESRWKRVRKHRVESASADDSGFLFCDEQNDGRQTGNAAGLISERPFPGDRLHDKYRPMDVAAVLGRGRENIAHLCHTP